MKLDEVEADAEYFPPVNRNIDRSIGFVIMFVIVLLAFSVFLLGILRFQPNAGAPSRESPRSAIQYPRVNDQSQQEIGDLKSNEEDSMTSSGGQ